MKYYEFTLYIRMLLALTVPQNRVVEDLRKPFDYFSEKEELLILIIDYFEGNWIDRLHRTDQKRESNILIRVWNRHKLVKSGIPRTNNSMEG